MSQPFSAEPPQRKSKQQATKNIANQARSKSMPGDPSSESSQFSTRLPVSIYGLPEDRGDISVPVSVGERELITNALLKTVSEMYFGTDDPFAEILRNMDDRIDLVTGRYISGLETFLKGEILENSNSSKSKERLTITALDMLACPFRRKQVIDNWTCRDVALFELGICQYDGYHPKKHFQLFKETKSIEELDAFYELYSKTDNYNEISKSFLKNEMDVDNNI